MTGSFSSSGARTHRTAGEEVWSGAGGASAGEAVSSGRSGRQLFRPGHTGRSWRVGGLTPGRAGEIEQAVHRHVAAPGRGVGTRLLDGSRVPHLRRTPRTGKP